MPQSVTQYRSATGNHLNWADKKQGNQKTQNERVQQLATRPGNHTANRDRQRVACAAVQLLSVLSSVQNTHTNPAITSRRGDELAAKERMAHADNLYRWAKADRAIRRETVRNVRQNSPAGNPLKSSGSLFREHEAASRDIAPAPLPELAQPADCLLSTAHPALASAISPSVFSKDCPDNDKSGFNSFRDLMSGVIASTSDFINQFDPLRFPVAAASALPPVFAAEKKGMYEIQPDVSKELFCLLTGREILQTSDGNPVTPVILFFPQKQARNRTRRANADDMQNAKETALQKYLADNCHIRTKTNQGEIAGDHLLVAGEMVRNPLRAAAEKAYKKGTGGHEIPQWMVNFTEGANLGYDIVLGVFTLGLYPVIKYASAKALTVSGHAINGDSICQKNEFTPEQLANLLFDTEVGITDRRAFHSFHGNPKPGEFKETRPLVPAGNFVHENVANNVNTEKQIVINHQGTVYSVKEKAPGEYWTSHPYAVKPERVEKRVYFDHVNKKFHFNSELPEGQGLDYDIIDGRNFINMHGENHELSWNWEKKQPEILAQKNNGETITIPVYMEPLSKSWHLSVHNSRPAFSNKQKKIISKIKAQKEEGFNYIAKGNNNQNYYGNGNIYAQEKMGDSGHYPWGRYIEMNGELVPVRNTRHKGQGVLYEAYDPKNPDSKGYPVEWDGNRWLFERKTSVHVSRELKKIITPEMFPKSVDARLLSAPDNRGLRYDMNGNKYLKIKGSYFNIQQRKSLPFIKGKDGNKIYIDFKKNKFTPVRIERENGIVISSPSEVKKDHKINSPSGLEYAAKMPLNEAWSLERVKIKNKNFNRANTAGSRIDVTLTLTYNKLKEKKYIELPKLEWKEKIECKEESAKWQFQTDMYHHNPDSKTFFPWRNRYTEAYNFSKVKDKAAYNSNVKIYKNNGEPVGVKEIKKASSRDEMASNIQNYLAKNGGIMEVTITDAPQLLKSEGLNHKERKIAFDIGFNNKAVAHFSQGIALHPGGKADIVVTTSDNIKLARGKVNSRPPEIVSKPRTRYLMKGEVY